MAFDACMMRAVLGEFYKEFPEAKIEKVLQPQNDEIDLLIHYGKNSRRLCFNVGPNAPRLQLSDTVKENPKAAPVFCMQLRKHLVGARIRSVSQPNFDRIAVFTLSSYDEMGYPTDKKLICEIMGKYANLILTDGEDKIITALKLIDFAASTVRQVLPGLLYRLPEKQDKLSPLQIDRAVFFSKMAEFPASRSAEKFITQNYSGIATRIARELVFRATGGLDTPISELDPERFYSVFSEWQKLLIEEDYTPTAILDNSGKPIDYSYMPMLHLECGAQTKSYASFRELFDSYFLEKDRTERIHQRAFDLIRLISNAISRTEKKLSLQREALIESERGEEYRKRGDLITANLYQIKRGMTSFKATDYYDENCPEVEIPLDARLYPAQNAQKMYKLYNKSKNAKIALTEQIARWEDELKYLESVSAFLDAAECEEDLVEIREELFLSGYASRLSGYRPQKKQKTRFDSYKTSGGFTVLVGRNNTQNDRLTHKVAENSDIWFHVKDIPGSHVILVTEGEEPSERDYTEAAEIAAYFSKAKGDLVAVDYTRVKNVKKPQGSKPGFVTYKTNYTAFVNPRKPEINGARREQ